MCKWQESNVGFGQYFTLGIERTTKFQIRRPGEEDEKNGEETKNTHLNWKQNPVNQPHTQPETVVNEKKGHNDTNDTASPESSESLANETSSEEGEGTNETSSEGFSSSEEQDLFNDTLTQSSNASKILHAMASRDQNYTHNKTTHYVTKRSIVRRNYKVLYEYLKRSINNQKTVRVKREDDKEEESEENESEEEEDDEEEDEDDEDNSTSEEIHLVIKLRGIRYRCMHSFISNNFTNYGSLTLFNKFITHLQLTKF